MMKTIFLLIYVISPLISFGQEFNKTDPEGKKTGYWKVFLDEKINLTDSLNAYFWAYEFYDDGKIIAQKFKKTSYDKNSTLIFDGIFPAKGNPVALNGVFKWFYNNKGKEELLEEDTYKNGFTLHLKEYAFGEIWLHYDFTRKYNNMEGSCYIINNLTYLFTTETRRKTTCYWYFKTGKRWKSVKTPCG
ncbi:hypothetical protein D3C71_953610 [compost metagenome]